MFNRIKKLKEEIKRVECETKDSIWLLNHPAGFKYGDTCSYHERYYEIETLIVLCEKGVTFNRYQGNWMQPTREYYVSVGDIESVGKDIIVLKECYLLPKL